MLWLVLAIIAAVFLAWNNGSNNAANAIGTIVGSSALPLRKALVIAALFEFIGAMTFGQFVSRTLMKGIIDITAYNDYMIVIKGMIAALLATGTWVIIATWAKIPMSISQGIVGGILGFGLISAGTEIVNWSKVTIIVISWFLVPVLSCLFGYLIYRPYMKVLENSSSIRIAIYVSLFIMVSLSSFLLLTDIMKEVGILYLLLIGLAIGAFAVFLYFICDKLYISKKNPREEWYLKSILLFASTSMAFSHGAHDSANAAGPLSAIIIALNEKNIPATIEPLGIALFIAGISMSIGILSWGYKVVETIGERITTLTYSTAFIAQFAASIAVIIITRLGLPVSTTATIVGSIAGVGFAKGLRAVNLKVLIRIFVVWLITVPAIALIAAAYYLLFLQI